LTLLLQKIQLTIVKKQKVFCKTRTKKSADGAEEHWIFCYLLGALQRQTPEKSRR